MLQKIVRRIFVDNTNIRDNINSAKRLQILEVIKINPGVIILEVLFLEVLNINLWVII